MVRIRRESDSPTGLNYARLSPSMRSWIFAFLVILLSANIFGLVTVYKKLHTLSAFFPLTKLDEIARSQGQLDAKIAGLERLMAQNTSSTLPDSILGASDILPDKTNNQNLTPKFLQTKDSSTPTQVYKEQADFSSLVGQLVPGYHYPYFTKMGDWYLIGLNEDLTGWVKSEEIVELP